MTRNEVLAEALYSMAISLKKFSSSKHHSKSDRNELISHLSAMQHFVFCIGMSEISDEQAKTIIEDFSYLLECDDDFALDLTFSDSEKYSNEHYDLLFIMSGVLNSCVYALTSQYKNYEKAVERMILAFHNLPRAFLSSENKMKISVKDALACYNSYFK